MKLRQQNISKGFIRHQDMNHYESWNTESMFNDLSRSSRNSKFPAEVSWNKHKGIDDNYKGNYTMKRPVLNADIKILPNIKVQYSKERKRKVVSRGTSTNPSADSEEEKSKETFYSVLNFSPKSFDKFKPNKK